MDVGFRDGMIALIPKLRAYATLLTGRTSEADDLVQDTLVRAWRFQKSYSPDTNLKAWLFKILRNEFYGQVQRGRRIVQDVDGQMAAQLQSAPEQEWRVSHRELVEGLKALTPDTREALLMVTVSGFTYPEAAELCGCAVGTLKSRVNRARARLAELIDPELIHLAPPRPRPAVARVQSPA